MFLNSRVWSRLVGPILFAIGLGALVEAALALTYQPNFWQRTTWLVHDPYRGEPFDRVMLFERLSNLEDTQPEIISVGDSSGFFGLQSTIINRYTNGVRYLSLNTGANYAYLGYRSVAQYMLSKPNSRIKWVVIYVYPQLLPEQEIIDLAKLAPYVYDTMVGPLSIVTPPSAFLSPYVKYKVLDDYRWHFGDPMLNATYALQLHAQVKQALGWLPETDVRQDRVNGQLPYFTDARSGILARLGVVQSSSIYATYDDFNNLVKSYGAHLAIAFAPVSERAIFPNETHIAESEAAMAKFSKDHPDVKFLFPLISRWHPEKFGTANHVSREYTFLSSMRMGKALARLAADPESFPTYEPSYREEPLPAVTHAATGTGDPDMLQAAFAFYLYTQTLADSYKERISRRVLALLERDEAFRFMMEDARARTQSFADRKIEVGFDLSKLRARPLAVTGMPFCNEGPDTQWVQVDGILNFTYRSPDAAPTPEPVRWPESSNIYFPLVREDGILKFDGYCPETGDALRSSGDSASN
jgi:hypothetical protein